MGAPSARRALPRPPGGWAGKPLLSQLDATGALESCNTMLCFLCVRLKHDCCWWCCCASWHVDSLPTALRLLLHQCRALDIHTNCTRWTLANARRLLVASQLCQPLHACSGEPRRELRAPWSHPALPDGLPSASCPAVPRVGLPCQQCQDQTSSSCCSRTPMVGAFAMAL